MTEMTNTEFAESLLREAATSGPWHKRVDPAGGFELDNKCGYPLTGSGNGTGSFCDEGDAELAAQAPALAEALIESERKVAELTEQLSKEQAELASLETAAYQAGYDL